MHRTETAIDPATAAALHRDAIIVDAVCPLLRRLSYVDWYAEGGVTVAAPTVGGTENAETALRLLGAWHRFIHDNDRLMLVRSAADIHAAKAAGKLGLVFHFQGTDPIEDDLDLVDAWAALGLRVVQLAYNAKNRYADGLEEAIDSGLSNMGRRLVERLNQARLVIDCAHTGLRSSLDAVALSTSPVVCSHGNPKGVFDCKRNTDDELIRAIAARGGVIGVVGFPAFIGRGPRPTLDDFIDHIAYLADLVGAEHVGLGIDYFLGQRGVMSDEEATAQYETSLKRGKWRPDTYPPPPYFYPEGIETPRTMPNLTAGLLRRGFSVEDARNILGANWVRVWDRVWQGG
jgi:membrane dipeptidase